MLDKVKPAREGIYTAEGTYEDSELNAYAPAPNQHIIIYRCPRKLCALAKELIKGAAAHFCISINILDALSMRHGDDNCRLEINIDE